MEMPAIQRRDARHDIRIGHTKRSIISTLRALRKGRLASPHFGVASRRPRHAEYSFTPFRPVRVRNDKSRHDEYGAKQKQDKTKTKTKLGEN